MPTDPLPRPSGPVLVRVSPEILERMKSGDIEPVVVMGIEEQDDGTYDMTLKRPDSSTSDAEYVAQAFHETYEDLAPLHGYKTRDASAVPWDEVPAENKALMVNVAHHLLDGGVISREF